MANKKISELPLAATLDGTEKVEIVQSGTNVQTTTQDIANLGADSGGDAVVFDTDILYFEAQEFFSVTTSGIGGWTSQVSGAGATFNQDATMYGVNTIEKAIGVAYLATGTTNTGRTLIYKPSFVLTTHAVRFRFRMALQDLSDGTDTYTIIIGATDFSNVATANPDNGIFFRYTHSVNGGEFEAVCRASAVETATDTNVAAAVTYKVFEISINQAGDSVTFYIDGVLVATITTNIPASSAYLSMYAQILKSAGTTNRKMHFDWTEVTFSRTTAR
jgi:hypothetical protein